MRAPYLSSCLMLLALFYLGLPIMNGALYRAKAQDLGTDRSDQTDSGLINPESLPSTRRPPRPPWELPATGSNPIALPPWGVLPEDFVVTRQMPLSSGQREVLMVSSSSRSEQRYLVNLPDAGQFEIYEVAFSNVLMDASKLLGSEAQLTPRQAQDLLRNFKVRFNNHALAEIILADGTKAEFQTTQTIIKSSSGQVLETIQLPQHRASKPAITLAAAHKPQPSFHGGQTVTPVESVLSQSLVAQTPLTCQSEVNTSMTQLSNGMSQWSTLITQSNIDVARLMGWALGYSADAMQNNDVSDESGLPDSVCRPPVQCEEKRVSGASETRTDLFEIPQGGNGSTVTLSYEFYTIPDRIEMYSDGRKLFEVGPISGSGQQQFTLPANGRQIGITLTGNQDPQTRWWYVISCTQNSQPSTQINNTASCRSNENVIRLSERRNIPRPVIDALEAVKADIQPLSEGRGNYVYDEYSVVIDRMPPGVTPKQFLDEFMNDPNRTVGKWLFDKINKFSRRDPSSPEVGSIYDIDLLGPDDGAVILSEIGSNYFVFTAIETPEFGTLPEFGSREFGFEQNSDGSVTFYTRGASRPSDILVDTFADPLQAYSWTLAMKGISDAIEGRGGQPRPNSFNPVRDERREPLNCP